MPAGWVSAGAAAVGAIESIAGNKGAQQAQKINNQIAQQNANAQGTALNKAEQIANQPFEAYTGTLTAPMSGNQQLGYDMAGKTAGQGQDLLNRGTGLIDQVAGNQWTPDTASKYMNPYTQAVTDQAVAAANRQYLQTLTATNENAARSGAYGGGHNAIEQAALGGQNALNVGQITAQGNANAYDQALATWRADNASRLSAANAYAAAGGDLQKMNSQDIQNLMKTGGVAQVISQTGLDAQYQQFLRQQGWSANQLQPLLQSLGKMQGGVTQSAPIQSNTANQILGLGSTLAGLFTQTPGQQATSGYDSLVNNTIAPQENASFNGWLGNTVANMGTDVQPFQGQ